MIVAFIGHNRLYSVNELLEELTQEIKKIILLNEKTLFYFGGIGDFDDICVKACLEIKKEWKSCELFLITPYININNKEILHYDGIIYPPIEKAPLKFAISYRNRWMVDKADVIIAYVDHPFGGAYNTLQYAKRKKKYIINLANQLNNKKENP